MKTIDFLDFCCKIIVEDHMEMREGRQYYKDDIEQEWDDFLYQMSILFENKLGFMPTHCHINPITEEITSNLVIIRDGEINTNHCWLGVPDVVEKP